MILALQTPEAANLEIKKWLYIEGKQVKVLKLTAEPLRCMKWQKIDTGLIAAECQAIHDVLWNMQRGSQDDEVQ